MALNLLSELAGRMEGGCALSLSITVTGTWGKEKRFLWLTALKLLTFCFSGQCWGKSPWWSEPVHFKAMEQREEENGAGIIYALQSHKPTNWRPLRKSHLPKAPSLPRSVGVVLSLYAMALWGPLTLWTVAVVKPNVPSTDCLVVYPSSAKDHLEKLRCLTSLSLNLCICQVGATTANVSPSSVVKITYFMCIKAQSRNDPRESNHEK